MLNKIFILIIAFMMTGSICKAQSFLIKNDQLLHTVSFSNNRLKFVLDYDHQCRVSHLEVNGQKVIDSESLRGRIGFFSCDGI